MGVELRSGRYYLYERKRVKGRLCGQYVCPLTKQEAKVFRAYDQCKRDQRRVEHDAIRQVACEADLVLEAVVEFDWLADWTFRVVMFSQGFHLHKRSEWRRIRGGRSMNYMAELMKMDDPRPPLFPLKVNDPDQQAVLDRAAHGDFETIPALEKMLTEQWFVEHAGAIAKKAQYLLISQASGHHIGVVMAMEKKASQYLKALLADAEPEPTYAEKWAASRAVHNWLAVHILEMKASKHAVGSAQALAIERRITAADRRLHAALKSMAVLRRLRKPVPVAQINVSNGPMLVNNPPQLGG